MVEVASSSVSGRLGFLAMALALVSGGFGCQQNSATQAVKEAKDPHSAVELLEAMAETYRNAKTYQDVGELRFLVEGAPEDESRAFPFLVAFARPDKIRVHSLDAIVVSDGQHLSAVAQSLPGQMLMRPSPPDLKPADFSADTMLEQAMRGQLDSVLPQLTLLLDPAAVQAMTAEGTPARLLDTELYGEKCHRVAVRSPQGKAVYWISVDSHLLRKLEFPLDAIKQQFPLAALWAEFRGASIDKEIADVAFQMEVPEDARLVKQFIMPAPVEPSPLLGKPAEDFTFVDLSGAPVTRDSLQGKIVVLDMWATWCHWCLEGLPLVEQVYEKYLNDDQVVFLAVSRDDQTISDEKVRDTLAQHKLMIPIVRDPREITERIFDAKALPTSVVLGKDGTIQDYHVGFDAEVSDTLPAKLEKLLAGENIAQQEIEAYQAAQKEYEARLDEALVERSESAEPEVARKGGTPQ